MTTRRPIPLSRWNDSADIKNLTDWKKFRNMCCEVCRENSKNGYAGWESEKNLYNQMLGAVPQDVRLKLFENSIKPGISDSSTRMKIFNDIRNDDNQNLATHVCQLIEKELASDNVNLESKVGYFLDLIYKALHHRKGASFLLPRWNITHLVTTKEEWARFRKDAYSVLLENQKKQVDGWTTEESCLQNLFSVMPKDILTQVLFRYSEEYPEQCSNREKILLDLKSGQTNELALQFSRLENEQRCAVLDIQRSPKAGDLTISGYNIFLELIDRFLICEGIFLRPLPSLKVTTLYEWRRFRDDAAKICKQNKMFGFAEWQTDEGIINQLLSSIPQEMQNKVFEIFVRSAVAPSERAEISEDLRKNSTRKLSSFISRLRLSEVLGLPKDLPDLDSDRSLHLQLQLIYRAAGATAEWQLPRCGFKVPVEAWNRFKADAIEVCRENARNRMPRWETEEDMLGNLFDSCNARVLEMIPRDVLLSIIDGFIEIKRTQVHWPGGPTEKAASVATVNTAEKVRQTVLERTIHLNKGFCPYISALDHGYKRQILGLQEGDDDAVDIDSPFNFILELLYRAQYEWVQLHVRGLGSAGDDQLLRSIFKKYKVIHAQVKNEDSGKSGVVTIASNANARLAIREMNKTKLHGLENGPILDVSVLDERGGGSGGGSGGGGGSGKPFHRKGGRPLNDWKAKIDLVINHWREYSGLNMSKCKMDEHATHSITPPYFTAYRDVQILSAKHKIPKDATIFDGTAGIGCDAISFMMNFGGKVVANEGDRDRFEMMKHNVGLVLDQVDAKVRSEIEFRNLNFGDFLRSGADEEDFQLFKECDLLHLNTSAIRMKKRDAEEESPIEMWGISLDKLVVDLLSLYPKLKFVVIRMPRKYCKKQLRAISETAKDQLRCIENSGVKSYIQFKSYEMRFSELLDEDIQGQSAEKASQIMNLVVLYRSSDPSERSNPEYVQVESCTKWCISIKGTVSHDKQGSKRSFEDGPGDSDLIGAESKKPRLEEEKEEADLLDEVVKNHYNERENFWARDTEREALEQKNMSNFIKSVLIASAVKPGCSVLDLACGKGGDLAKWCKQKIRHYVGIDIADASVKDAVDRYTKGRNIDFPAIWCAGSFVKENLLDKLDTVAPGIYFDAVSCQFAIHYSWTSEVNARNALKNAAGRLKKGGLFIGITTDANVLVKNLQAADGLKFGNSLYNIKFLPEEGQTEETFDKTFTGRSPFGIRYYFFLKDAVDCEECLVHFPTMKRLAREVGLEVVEEMNLCDYFERATLQSSKKFENIDLMKRMKVLDRKGTISEDQWEVIHLYKTFVMMKKEDLPKEIRDKKWQCVAGVSQMSVDDILYL